MTPLLWIIGGIIVGFVIVLALALCRAAARGDEMQERWDQERDILERGTPVEDDTAPYPYEGPGAK